MKISANTTCPCGSNKKYKKCCRVFHNGENPSNALELMKSRYCAYALNNAQYIINTTHKDNSEYKEETYFWKKNIEQFITDSTFESLEIIDFIDGVNEAFVTFKANIIMDKKESSFCEKSRFVKQDGIWLYISGEFI